MKLGLALGFAAFAAACGGGGTEPDPPGGECTEVDSGDQGDLAALKAQRCNVPGSMGAQNWYRLSATLPDSTAIVQVELWPNRGAFVGKTVMPGTYTITGDDLDFAKCGVCLRGMTDKGTDLEKEFFGVGGSIDLTAVSPDAEAPFEATLTSASLSQVNSDHVAISDGCTLDVARVKMTGKVMPMGGTGGGGGGGGGSGAGGCKTTVGD